MSAHADIPCAGLYRWITWLLRISTGATFIFSGFVKAIDPWGTLYKIQDYLGVMGLNVPVNLVIAGVFALCAYEFCIGIFLFFGCYRKSAPIAGMLLMAFMLPLTLWIALKNPVADCGCFGDAYIISNWATFWKNVALSAAMAWLIRCNRMCICLIRPYVQWLAMLFSAIFIVGIGLIGYVYQPLIDFRPFPIGTNLARATDDATEESRNLSDDTYSDSSAEESETDEMIFVYAKNGVEKKFSIDDELPDEDEGWQFVRRETEPSDKPNKGSLPAEHVAEGDEGATSLHLWSEDGEEEMTVTAIRAIGKEILLLMPDLKSVSMAETWKINSLYKWASDNNMEMIGVVAGAPADIANWKDISLAAYPIYTAEDTQIKMLARGNPAVVYLQDGTIRWKSSLRALFTEDFQSAETGRDAGQFFIDNEALLMRLTYTYLAVLAFLVAFSFLPMIARFFPEKVEKSISRSNEKISDTEKKMEHFNQSRHSDVEKKKSL